jgi:hypothetical protein
MGRVGGVFLDFFDGLSLSCLEMTGLENALPGPLVLGKGPLNALTPTTDTMTQVFANARPMIHLASSVLDET